MHHPGLSLFPSLQLVLVLIILTSGLIFPGKMLSGEEDGLEDDAERTEVTTGAFAGNKHKPGSRN